MAAQELIFVNGSQARTRRRSGMDWRRLAKKACLTFGFTLREEAAVRWRVCSV